MSLVKNPSLSTLVEVILSSFHALLTVVTFSKKPDPFIELIISLIHFSFDFSMDAKMQDVLRLYCYMYVAFGIEV
jgi:hypothetical protein